jgi:hypothetical protein
MNYQFDLNFLSVPTVTVEGTQLLKTIPKRTSVSEETNDIVREHNHGGNSMEVSNDRVNNCRIFSANVEGASDKYNSGLQRLDILTPLGEGLPDTRGELCLNNTPNYYYNNGCRNLTESEFNYLFLSGRYTNKLQRQLGGMQDDTFYDIMQMTDKEFDEFLKTKYDGKSEQYQNEFLDLMNLTEYSRFKKRQLDRDNAPNIIIESGKSQPEQKKIIKIIPNQEKPIKKPKTEAPIVTKKLVVVKRRDPISSQPGKVDNFPKSVEFTEKTKTSEPPSDEKLVDIRRKAELEKYITDEDRTNFEKKRLERKSKNAQVKQQRNKGKFLTKNPPPKVEAPKQPEPKLQVKTQKEMDEIAEKVRISKLPKDVSDVKVPISEIEALEEKIKKQQLTNLYQSLEPLKPTRDHFMFSYLTWDYEPYWCIFEKKVSKLAFSIIPIHIKDILLPMVPVDKAYHLYVAYLQKAQNDKRIQQWYMEATNAEVLCQRRLTVQRFYWFDHLTMTDSKKVVQGHQHLIADKNETKTYFNQAPPYEAKIMNALWRNRIILVIMAISIFFTTWGLPSQIFSLLLKIILFVSGLFVSVISFSWNPLITSLQYMQYTDYLQHFKNVFFTLIVGNILLFVYLYFTRKRRLRDGPRQLLLFDDLPWLSVWIEELVKRVPFGTEYIGLIEYFKYGTWQNYYMHKAITGDLEKCISKHIAINERLWNHWSQQKLDISFETYLSKTLAPMTKPNGIMETLHYNALHINRKPLPQDTIEPTLMQIPPMRYSKVKGELIKECIDTKYYQGTFPLVFFSTNLIRPAKTKCNIEATIEGRLHVKVPGSLYRGEQDFSSMLTQDCIMQSECDHIKQIYTRDHWWNELGKKQKDSILKDRKRYEHTKPKCVELNIKADELLHNSIGLECLENDEQKYVPRSLFNLSGYWLDKMGYDIDVLTKALKERFNKNGTGRIDMGYVGKQGYRTYVIFFSCGATSEDLDHFRNLSRSAPLDEFWFTVMGDDMGSLFAEADFSKFDRTQSKALIKRLMDQVKWWGFPELKKVWKFQYALPKKAFHKESGTEIHMRQKVGKMTGETATCWSNSIFNIYSTIFSHHNFECEDVTEGYLNYGFVVKYQNPKYITYLKGVYLKNVIGRDQWTRLPSFIGKFGKVLSDYTTLPGLTGSIQERAATMLWSQWLGYGDMQSNWFYMAIHKQIERISRLYLKKLPAESISLEKWQIKASKTIEITDDVFNLFVYERYGLDKDDLQTIIDLYSQVKIIPCVITCPIATWMVDRDYM